MPNYTGSRFKGMKNSWLWLWVFLGGCSSVELEQYADNQPQLDVRTFFNGELTAEGIVKNRSGTVTRYFTATIVASWNDNGQGRLDEVFIFNDGEEQQRTWILAPLDQHRYQATANDVVGEHLLETAGNALFMAYVLRIPYKDGTLDVSVEDRMYLVDDNTIINESTLYKFGFRVGSVVLTIQR